MVAPVIIPAILTDSFEELQNQIHRLEKVFSHIHIDILDNTLVPGMTFPIEQVNSIATTAKLELHIMSDKPAEHIERWAKVKNVFRVIVHVEAQGNVHTAMNAARGNCWQVGIAINPKTSLGIAERFVKKADIVQFMTVHPGQQGAAFVPEVLEKIKTFTGKKNHPPCSVDGAVSEKTAAQLREAGVDVFVAGSYFTKATDLKKNLETLQTLF